MQLGTNLRSPARAQASPSSLISPATHMRLLSSALSSTNAPPSSSPPSSRTSPTTRFARRALCAPPAGCSASAKESALERHFSLVEACSSERGHGRSNSRATSACTSQSWRWSASRSSRTRASGIWRHSRIIAWRLVRGLTCLFDVGAELTLRRAPSRLRSVGERAGRDLRRNLPTPSLWCRSRWSGYPRVARSDEGSWRHGA